MRDCDYADHDMFEIEVESEADGAFRALHRRQVRTSPLARKDDLVQD